MSEQDLEHAAFLKWRRDVGAFERVAPPSAVFTDGFRAGRASSFDMVRRLVDEQAEDAGLWFEAKTMPEAYLQQELRRLHALVEGSVPAGVPDEPKEER